eukprot:m.109402 g.109402  ORF g.109402 m.109402 type:complete len:858 (+) comp9299_c0_seq1:67-2640(+)
MGQSASAISTVAGSDEVAPWVLLRTSSGDGEEICVFEHEHRGSSPAISRAIDNAIAHLRRLRHPAIVKFLWLQDDKAHTSMVTEPVVPLSRVLAGLDAADICVGLAHIAQGLSFLHEQCGVVHANLHLGALFEAEKTHQWRLGAFECAGKPADVTPERLKELETIRGDSAATPFDDETGPSLPLHARDVYAFGTLVDELAERIPELANDASFVGFLDSLHTQLNVSNASHLPTFKQLLALPYFQNDALLSCLEFLESLTLKSAADKQAFFSLLPRKLHTFSAVSVGRNLVPKLLQPFLFAEPGFESVLEAVLCDKARNPNGIFDQAALGSFVVPSLERLFESRFADVRIPLLRHLPHYCHAIPLEELQTRLLPVIKEGLSDANDDILSATLIALGHLVPYCEVSITGHPRQPIFCDSPKPRRSLLGETTVRSLPTSSLASVRDASPVLPIPGPGESSAKANSAPTLSVKEMSKARREAARLERQRARVERQQRLEAEKKSPRRLLAVKKLGDSSQPDSPSPDDEVGADEDDNEAEKDSFQRQDVEDVVNDENNGGDDEDGQESDWGEDWGNEGELDAAPTQVASSRSPDFDHPRPVATAPAEAIYQPPKPVSTSITHAAGRDDGWGDAEDWGDMEDDADEDDNGNHSAWDSSTSRHLSKPKGMSLTSLASKKREPALSTTAEPEPEAAHSDEPDLFADMIPTYKPPASHLLVEDKPAEEEADLFADMVPTYQPPASVQLDDGAASVEKAGTTAAASRHTDIPRKTSMLEALVAEDGDDDDGGAWGGDAEDDLDFEDDEVASNDDGDGAGGDGNEDLEHDNGVDDSDGWGGGTEVDSAVDGDGWGDDHDDSAPGWQDA